MERFCLLNEWPVLKTNIDWKKNLIKFQTIFVSVMFWNFWLWLGKKSDSIAKPGVRLDLWDNARNILHESFLNESISVLLLDDIILQGVKLKRKKWVRFGICLFSPSFPLGLIFYRHVSLLNGLLKHPMLQCIFCFQVKNSLHCFGLVFFSKEFTIETGANLL